MVKSQPYRKKIFFRVFHIQPIFCISKKSFPILADTYFSCHLIYMVFHNSVLSHMLSPLHGIPFFHFLAENTHHLRFISSISSSEKFSLSQCQDALLFAPNAVCTPLSQHLPHCTIFVFLPVRETRICSFRIGTEPFIIYFYNLIGF